MSTSPIIFPRRQLGLQSLQTPKSEQMCIKQLSLIAIANLVPGDRIPFAKGTIVVVSNDDESLQYDFIRQSGPVTREAIAATQIMDSSIFAAFQKKVPELSPAYSHPLCVVIERDPAVYRLRTQTGWVINDALSVMSGNVIYPRGPGVGLRTATPGESFEPVREIDEFENALQRPSTEAMTPSAESDPKPEESPLACVDTSKPSPIAMQGSFDF